MRSPAILPTLLVAAVVACTDAGPTAPADRATGAAARAAANDAILPFHGVLDAASHTSVYDPGTNAVLVHLVGTGHATHLGRYALVTDIVFPDPSTISGTERMTLTAANGDMLFATGTAEGTPSEDGQSLSSLEILTITGGTGRFAGATGSFTLRQVNLAPDRLSSGAFDGFISFGERASR